MQQLVLYGDMVFDRACPNCGRFTKAPDEVEYSENALTEERKISCPAHCSRCGGVELRFEGYFAGQEVV